MARAEEIVQNYDPSLENKLKQLKMSLQDRLETIHSLDADILDTLEDEKDRRSWGSSEKSYWRLLSKSKACCHEKPKTTMSMVLHGQAKHHKAQPLQAARETASIYLEEFLWESKPVAYLLG